MGIARVPRAGVGRRLLLPMEVGQGHGKSETRFSQKKPFLFKNPNLNFQVVYFTATVPYLLLSVFLVRSVTLPGAWEGLRFFLEPRWDKMAEPKVRVQTFVILLLQPA